MERAQAVNLQAIAREAMLVRGLLPDFAPEVLAQVSRLPDPAPEISPTADMRPVLWCSIDNDDTRDLDQLTFAKETGQGSTQLWIAVADVVSRVRKDSPADVHARHNTTSVYTPGGVFPMLPEQLSTGLTSLNPGADRLALVVSVVVDSQGDLQETSVIRALVHNHAQLEYDEVAAWLEGTGPAPSTVSRVAGLGETLRVQDSAAQRLRKRRQEQGSLELDTAEPKIQLGRDGAVHLKMQRKNRARTLIEEFMVAANRSVASHLEEKGISAIRRVIREPARWDRIVALAAELQYELPAAPNALALSGFLARQKENDPEQFPDLSSSIVKLLGRGEYQVEIPGQQETGHFGLAVGNYAHSTAPNRRYADLVTQRSLTALITDSRQPYETAELVQIAAHCNKQERAAEKVERSVRKAASALLMADRVGEEFEAIVTGVSSKGTWIRTLAPPVEGKLESSGVDVGDRLRVRLVRTDAGRGHIDFEAAVAR